jgi:DNA-binding MarR family transcriptional regulator
MSRGASAGPATDIWPALQETFTEFRSIGSHFLREQGLSMGQYLTLHRIQKVGDLRLSTLAADLGVSRPATTELVASLEARGWVRRERTPTDRRGVIVRVTPKTVRLMGRFDRELATVVRRSTAKISPDRRERTAETLAAVSLGLRTYRTRTFAVGAER